MVDTPPSDLLRDCHRCILGCIGRNTQAIEIALSHIFISYVREDQTLVDRLVGDLTAKGAEIWLDRESINPGQMWQDAIRKAIEDGNYFIACFSNSSVTKRKSGMNEELLIAVEELRKMQ